MIKTDILWRNAVMLCHRNQLNVIGAWKTISFFDNFHCTKKKEKKGDGNDIIVIMFTKLHTDEKFLLLYIVLFSKSQYDSFD
jgi:hypothetical protein